jgi:hypothetical protein
MPILELTPHPRGAEEGDYRYSLEGSGTAFPPGLELVFEYNQMIFNKLDTIDKIRITRIDGFADADVRDNRENNPSADGEMALDAFYGGRTIAFTGRIEAYRLEKLRDMQQAFRQAFTDIHTEYPLIMHGYGFVDDGNGGIMRGPSLQRTGQIYCKKFQPITMTEEQQDFRFFREFMLTLRASDPRFSSYMPNLSQWQASSAGSVTNAPFPNVINIGNYMALPTIELHGPMTNPVITNTRSNESIKLIGTIAAGNVWTIDVGDKTLLDQTGASLFRTLTVDSDFFPIYPSLNAITMTASGLTTASNVVVSFRHSWI